MVALKNGQVVNADPDCVVECPIHGYKTTWGELDTIQQMAVISGLDLDGDVCIFENSNPQQEIKE